MVGIPHCGVRSAQRADPAYICVYQMASSAAATSVSNSILSFPHFFLSFCHSDHVSADKLRSPTESCEMLSLKLNILLENLEILLQKLMFLSLKLKL